MQNPRKKSSTSSREFNFLRGGMTSSLSEGITRRFIKRTGEANVGTVLTLNAFSARLSANQSSCKCITISVPTGGTCTIHLSGTTTAQQVKESAEKNGGATAGPITPCGSREPGITPSPEPGGGVSHWNDGEDGWRQGGITNVSMVGSVSVTICGLK
jgi:hypothetical protein